MAKEILKQLPNSYAFTKALAEALVNEACQKDNLPAMILRPSIVIPTLNGKGLFEIILNIILIINN